MIRWQHRRMLRKMIPWGNSQVTITLRELIDGGFCPFDAVDKYPIWDEKHRAELEKKIIEHYMFRQIGFETPGRFKFELNKKMREIMPYFIKIWKTTQYEYNPIENYNMREGGSDESESTTADLSTFHETPGESIENIDEYLTNATKGKNTGTGKSKHEFHRSGNIGVTTTQQMIESERKATIDVDMMIIDELKNLFLGVY